MRLKQVECEMLAAAVIDIHLPDFSGLVLSAKLRQQYGPKLPIIVLSEIRRWKISGHWSTWGRRISSASRLIRIIWWRR